MKTCGIYETDHFDTTGEAMGGREKRRIPAIDCFRYICAVLVVAIHTRPFEEISPILGLIASDVIPRIAVPFFFVVSGYFYFQKRLNGEKPFCKTFKRLILIYALWSCPFFLLNFIQWGCHDIKGYIVSSVMEFFLYGSYYHFWFFPALLVSMCLSELLWRINCKFVLIPLGIFLYVIGCLGCAYYFLCDKVPFLGCFFAYPQFTTIRRIFLMGFPFFVGGYMIQRIGKQPSEKARKTIWIVSFLLWASEIVCVFLLHCQRSIVLTFALYPFVLTTLSVLLHSRSHKMDKFAADGKKIANFTYYSHPVWIMTISSIYHTAFQQPIPNTLLFMFTTVVTFAVGKMLCGVKKPVIDVLLK